MDIATREWCFYAFLLGLLLGSVHTLVYLSRRQGQSLTRALGNEFTRLASIQATSEHRRLEALAALIVAHATMRECLHKAAPEPLRREMLERSLGRAEQVLRQQGAMLVATDEVRH